MNDHVYLEQSIQAASVRWLTINRGYKEVLADPAATGDRMDSLGRMSGRTVVIEVKANVHAGIVSHRSDRAGTIESKIAGTLVGAYGSGNDRLSNAIRYLWDRTTPLMVGVLAAHYTKGGNEELTKMLTQRSHDWLFDFRVWHWTGDAVVELEAGDLEPRPTSEAYAAITIESLVGRSPRNAPLGRETLRSLAAERNVLPLLDHVLLLSRTLGYRVQRTRGGILLRRRARTGGWESIAAVYLLGSDEASGLNVGCWKEGLGVAAANLPGQPAPRMGFLNTNRFLSSHEEIKALLNMFALQN